MARAQMLLYRQPTLYNKKMKNEETNQQQVTLDGTLCFATDFCSGDQSPKKHKD